MSVYRWYKNPSTRAYTAAVLLHVLLFLFWGSLQEALRLVPAVPQSVDPEPVRFEFVDVQDLPSEQPVETPLASHQNQVAKDLQDTPLSKSNVPYTDGLVQNKESLDQMAQQAQNTPPQQAQQQKDVVEQSEPVEDGFDFSDILKQDPKEVKRAEERAVFGRAGAPLATVPHENTKSRALDRGGLQLSTYAWNYAPYMAYLKRQIDRHIFPPRAFELGIIDGVTQVRFRIYRDGRLEGPNLLAYKGSDLLKDTSLKAVELSAPFKALPKDFPDAYLEITGTFEFVILRGP